MIEPFLVIVPFLTSEVTVELLANGVTSFGILPRGIGLFLTGVTYPTSRSVPSTEDTIGNEGRLGSTTSLDRLFLDLIDTLLFMLHLLSRSNNRLALSISSSSPSSSSPRRAEITARPRRGVDARDDPDNDIDMTDGEEDEDASETADTDWGKDAGTGGVVCTIAGMNDGIFEKESGLLTSSVPEELVVNVAAWEPRSVEEESTWSSMTDGALLEEAKSIPAGGV